MHHSWTRFRLLAAACHPTLLRPQGAVHPLSVFPGCHAASASQVHIAEVGARFVRADRCHNECSNRHHTARRTIGSCRHDVARSACMCSFPTSRSSHVLAWGSEEVDPAPRHRPASASAQAPQRVGHHRHYRSQQAPGPRRIGRDLSRGPPFSARCRCSAAGASEWQTRRAAARDPLRARRPNTASRSTRACKRRRAVGGRCAQSHTTPPTGDAARNLGAMGHRCLGTGSARTRWQKLY